VALAGIYRGDSRTAPTHQTMTIDEKVRKTLAELGPTDPKNLFDEVRVAMEEERSTLVSRGAASESERDKL